MKLNIKEWEYFKLKDLFTDYTGGDLIIREIEDGDIPVASNSVENNNIATYSSYIEGRKLFDHTKSISIADRGKFWAFIQPKDFYIGTRVKALVSKKEDITINQLAFITTIINQESFKFSYGRNCCNHLTDIKIKLPVDLNKKIDWQFMEDYIKLLHYKPLTTKNTKLRYNLNVQEWKFFNLKELFSSIRGKRLVIEERIDGIIPFVTAGEFNNGVSSYISNDIDCYEKKNYNRYVL